MFRRGILLVAGVATVATLVACSGGGSDDDDAADDGGGQVTDSEPVRGADVAQPTVTGPVTAGSHDGPFNAMPSGLADRYGYVEEEYFLEGDASAYAVQGEQSEDGAWDVTEAGTAPYKTRVIVRRPADADDFSGTVYVEWLNVTAGIDGDPDFGLNYPVILGDGSAYVGVSAQRAGIEGGGVLAVPGVPARALKQWDPERYGDLVHPGDQYSYDMYSQAAQAVRRPGDVDILDGLEVRKVIAMGESQSAARMVAYIDAVHPVADIFDGFLVHSRGGGAAPLEDTPDILGQGVVRIRDDLNVPVMQFQTETDLFGLLGFHRASQDDTDMLRTWEAAGTAHADQAILDYNSELASEEGGSGFDLAAMCGSINTGPQAQVVRAALSALRDWVVDGTKPPEAPRLEVSGEAIARDSRGIALGGIRTPGVDAPLSVLTGEAPAGRSVLCMLFGDTVPFDAATIASLYPGDDDYVAAVTDSADAAVDAGFLLRDDADAFIDAAGEAQLR
jgi:Alpha/beta hydrolase domain